jgi:hypothetical protein
VYNLSDLTPSESDNDPETVKRLRGRWQVRVASGDLAVGFGDVYIGVGVAPRDAVNNGFVPTPTSLDSSWDGWLWHDVILGVASPANPANERVLEQSTLIDSRAMRRLEDNVLFCSVAYDSTEGPQVLYDIFFRWLLVNSSAR